MPRGKALIVGGSFPLPNLPDCACMWLLTRDIKPQHKLMAVVDLTQNAEKINRAVRIYIGRTIHVTVPTDTTVNKLMQGIILAARRLVTAHDSAKTQQAEKWAMKFVQKINAAGDQAYQFLTGEFIKQCEGTISPDTIQDFIESPKSTRVADHIETLRVIASLRPDEPRLDGFPNPHLADLVSELAPIWTNITGRSPLPTSVAKDSSEKKYLFAEWVAEIIRTANNALPQKQQVSIPKDGAILDIAQAISRKPK